MKHFLDTFALIEILRGNPPPDIDLDASVTGLYNLYELHVVLARQGQEREADEAFETARSYLVTTEEEDVLEASRVKRTHPKAGLSYADALGYAMARRRGFPFVTGDKAFVGLDGVHMIIGSHPKDKRRSRTRNR